MNGLSLFANVGVAETYLSKVGINIVVANELLPDRARFYRHLYPSCDMVCGDIKSKAVYNQVISSARKQKVSFLLATPPCQGMSIAGKSDPNDPRNLLITSVANAIKDLQPQYVMIENVFMQLKTYITHHGKKMLIPEYLDSEFGAEYYIETQVIDTKHYGVPQQRKRAIMLLSKRSLGCRWTFPAPSNHIITLAEAIGDLPSLDPLVKEKKYRKAFPHYQEKLEAGLAVSKWHFPKDHVWRNVEVMMHTPTGCSARQNKVFFPKRADGKMVGGAPRTYMRMDWEKPAPTITSYNHTISSFQNVHPGKLDKETGLYSDARVLSILELMRVMSLPDDWNIPDWAPNQLIRTVIGEGIPPEAVRRMVAQLNLPR